MSAVSERRAMDEPVRWLSKAEAAQELEVSLSTLDRMIRKGKVEVVREGRRVYVRMRGPEQLSDEELLRQTITKLGDSERTVRQLERSASELKLRASELERERDEARDVRIRQQTARTRSLRTRTAKRRAAHGRDEGAGQPCSA